MISRTIAFVSAAVTILLVAPAAAQDLNLPRQKIELVAPPFVHPHEQATDQGPKILEFTLVAEEKEMTIDDAGTKLQAMTFNGSIQGRLMGVHEGCYGDLTLVNPASSTVPDSLQFT